MNRDVGFVEFKNGDQLLTAKQLIENQLKKINQPIDSVSKDQWAFYCNDKLVSEWSKKIRPRSKLLIVSKKKKPLPIEIVYEDDGILVVNKPQNLPTQPTLKDFEDNLFERVRYHFIHQKNFPVGLPYVGLHHRLDRGTSGLVLMTKQRSANKEVSELFKGRKIKKTYRARTEIGEIPPEKRWRQVDNIRRGSAKKMKFFFEVAQEGDEAITEFQLLSTSKEFHEFHCFPKTGRTHQLRVQLSHKGYPILGDRVYGSKNSGKSLMLHAEKLQFSFRKKQIEVSVDPHWQ